MNELYRVAPVARDDLDDIWDYLADKNPSAATKLVEKFEKAFWLLGHNPNMGRSRAELMPGLRSFPVDRYLIFYRQPRTKTLLSK